MSKIFSGQVKIILDGEERILKPTIPAMRHIDAHFGGYQPAFDALRRSSVSACAFIVRHGLGMDDREAKEVFDKVARTGTAELVGPLSEFIAILANGGRPLNGEAEKDQEGNG